MQIILFYLYQEIGNYCNWLCIPWKIISYNQVRRLTKLKIFLYVFHKIANVVIQEVETVLKFLEINFFYLRRMSIANARKKKVYFIRLIKKLHNKLKTWKEKLHFFGEKTVLINNVLSSIFMYLFLDINAPKYVIHD